MTKWIEVEPVASITASKVTNFVWKNIVCRFSVPQCLISDNGTQFLSTQFRKFCEELKIKQRFSSVEHPQTNGQAEAANKVILNALRRRISKAKTCWPDELPRIIWAYHTTPQSSTHETPFSLVYGTDALLPIQVDQQRDSAQRNDEPDIRANLDILDEVRELARITSEAMKKKVERRYKTKVRPRDFMEHDLVLRKAHAAEIENKLSPKWTGPFRVKTALPGGAYKLETLDGAIIPRTWNATNLRFYFS